MKQTIRFQLDGVTYQVEVERKGDQLIMSREGERYTVSLLDTQAPTAAVASPAPAPAAAPAAAAQPGEAGAKAGKLGPGVLRAPMTGLVKEVKVAAGSRVAKGDVVLVMEAMKMDVEVSAPASGVVAEVNVSAGQSVEAQAPLLRIHG